MSVQTVATVWGAKTRSSIELETTMLGLGNNVNIAWSMYTSTVYDEDTGKENLRIRHHHIGNIMATDTVRFEVVF